MKELKKSGLVALKTLSRDEMKGVKGGKEQVVDPPASCHGECGAGAGVCKAGCTCRNWYCS